MAWDDDKSTAADPDNPTANEQLSADEWDAHVADQKGHASRHDKGGADELTSFGPTGSDLFNSGEILLVGVDGLFTSRDPTASSTPIQDAIDEVSTAGGGEVWLPPTSISEASKISMKDYVSLRGFGRQNTVINFTSSGATTDHGIHWGDVGGIEAHIWGSMTLSGPGDGVVTGYGMFFDNINARKIHINNIEVNAWGNSAIRMEGAAGQLTITRLRANLIDAGDKGGCIDVTNSGPAVQIGMCYIIPSKARSASPSDIINISPPSAQGVSFAVRQLNIGGAPARAASVTGDTTMFRVDETNYEPTSDGDPFAIWRLRSSGYAYIGPTNLNDTSIAPAPDYTHQLVTDGTSLPGNKTITKSLGVSPTTNQVSASSDLSEVVRFEGLSTEVTNNSGGTLTNGVACIDDFTVVT